MTAPYRDQLGRPIDSVDRAYEDGWRRTWFRRMQERMERAAQDAVQHAARVADYRRLNRTSTITEPKED